MPNVKKAVIDQVLKFGEFFFDPKSKSYIQFSQFVRSVPESTERFKKCFFKIVRGFQHQDSRDNTLKLMNRKIRNYQVVEPGFVSGNNRVPSHILTPSYCSKNAYEEIPSNIIIKTEKQIESIRLSCALASKILKKAETFIEVGKTTDELDTYIHNLIIEHNAYPSPLNYQGFPKSICTSVNNVVCHGIPDDRKLVDGDIISVDITVYLNGFHGDCAVTFLVGNVDDKGRQLVENTKKILDLVIEYCGPGVSFNVIGKVITETVIDYGLVVIPCVFGHGIGEYFHELPNVSHYDDSESNASKMLPGMTFTIEPVLSDGSQEVVLWDDGWTVLTEDGSLAAQFEHTILITETGAEVLTK